MAWIESPGGAERLNFYSAREEQMPDQLTPNPKPPAKKAGTRRVTAAALAETVAALTSHVKLFADQQETMMKQQSPQPSAIPVPGPVFGAGVPGKLPAVSANVPQTGLGGIASIGQLLGPPPKAKQPQSMFVPDVPGAETMRGLPVVQESQSSEVSNALLQQSQAITSFVAHLTGKGILSQT